LSLSNLTVRVLTAAVAIPILLAAAMCPRVEGAWVLIFLFTVAGLDEFFRLALPGAGRTERLLAVTAGATFSAAVFWCPDGEAPLLILALTVMVAMSAHLWSGRQLSEVGSRAGLTVLGILYVGLLFTTLALLRKPPLGVAWVGLALAMTFSADTLAYFTGRWWGRRKLHPRISPGKTVEGAAGGTLGSIGAAVLFKLWLLPDLTWADCLLLGAPAAFLDQIGDLCESMLKRGAGVKDSGRLMPGHGGVLDRIDGLLFVSPYVYVYARWALG